MATPNGPAPRSAKPRRILFVCLGNICRSPAAEGIFRDIVARNGGILVDGRPAIGPDEWTVDSAGTGAWHVGELPDSRMRVHARRRGYELTHHARRVCPSDFDEFDLIIAMDDGNVAQLRRLAPTAEGMAKVRPMAEWLRGIATRHDHIPDPYYEGAEGFELVLDLLENALSNLYLDIR